MPDDKLRVPPGVVIESSFGKMDDHDADDLVLDSSMALANHAKDLLEEVEHLKAKIKTIEANVARERKARAELYARNLHPGRECYPLRGPDCQFCHDALEKGLAAEGQQRPHGDASGGCPTYYDGCNCTVDTLENLMKDRDRLIAWAKLAVGNLKKIRDDRESKYRGHASSVVAILPTRFWDEVGVKDDD